MVLIYSNKISISPVFPRFAHCVTHFIKSGVSHRTYEGMYDTSITFIGLNYKYENKNILCI